MTAPAGSSEENLNKHTREVYHQQHLRMEADEITRTRLMGMTNEDFFQVPVGFFSGKRVLDAGCGSIIRNAVGFYQMGSRDVTALDIGSEWFESGRKIMRTYSIPEEGIRFVSGNVIELPFDAESFDFVCCDGVLPHLASTAQVEAAIKEVGRVTRRGGFVFISYMAGGGLVETKIHDAMRDLYKENGDFASFIDRVRPEALWQAVEFVKAKVELHNGESLNLSWLKELLDEDFCISLQNTCQAQRRETQSPAYVGEHLAKAGFEAPRRLTRFVKRKNIRKFMAPFHFYHDNPMSRLLYGDGWVDCLARKKDDSLVRKS
jgi:ubiquinone/menaquinone biosynthesis C-methylase UbiE